MTDEPPKAALPVVPVVATVVWLGGLALSVVPAMFSVMAFDAPGSEDNPWTWLFVGGIWSFPILCGISILAVWPAWFFTRRGGRGLRVAVALLPLLGVASAGCGVAALQVFCGGSFSC